MILDREFQLEIMKKMAEVYPAAYDFWSDNNYQNSDIKVKLYTNLYYLQSHGLLEPKSIHYTNSLDGIGSWNLGNTRLNHKGMDFLADDGGLSAILGTVTIKFETEQLKAILTAKIMSSNLSSERKTTMIDAIKELPAEGLKHLTMKIVDAGWDNMDSLMSLIQSALP
ncbi:hypothetical protein [Acinetobacter sp. YH12073]|uniref:hypothetical protein n=1 Tax=Acinetobacter sp. YH12073 TaxID=2601069 RepID=UPI0015D19799|nr:hypothetical protein [Acinetobacter sp. YH12073]